MNKFLVLPSTSACVALISCATPLVWSPHVAGPIRCLFLLASVLCAFFQAPYIYSIGIGLINLLFLLDGSVLYIDEQWTYAVVTTNLCAFGLFLVCREISEWNIYNMLSHKQLWKSLPEITFLDDYFVPTKDIYPHGKVHELGFTSPAPGEFTKTDFEVDNQGVRGLVQTTIKPIKYQDKIIAHCQIETQVQLSQSALVDMFSCLNGSEDTYKELFGHALDHARLMLDSKGNVASWSPGVLKVIGYSKEEILGKHSSIFYSIEDRVAGSPLADLAMARSEGRTETERWMPRKTGELFWSSTSITAIRNSSHQLLGYSVIMRDHTDKKRHIETLQATEEKYHLLVSSVTDYTIIMLDPNGIITTWNAGAQKINGYHAEEVIGRHFSIFYDEEGRALKKPEHELEVASRDGRFEEEGWRVKKDGSRYYASVVLSAIYNARRDIVGFSKVTRDITDKIKAQATQEQLRMMEEKFQMLISSVKDYAIFMLDPDGIIVSWNQGAQRIKGYTAEEAIGKHFSIVYTPEERANDKPHLVLETAAREGRYENEGLRVRKDGSTFWANVIITPIRDNTGKLVGYSKVTRDITERRQADIALRAAMQSAQTAALAKQSFLAVMSHEIRTPLHAVITLSLLLQSSDLNAQQRDYLETIHNSSKQLLGIINDILDFTKIESGKMELAKRPFNLRQCIEETFDLVLVKPVKAVNHLDVVYILKGVPEVIIADSVRVRQILMNYLSNAVKFTEKGEVVVRVSCEPTEFSEADTVTLTFAVHDTGIGIKSPNLDDLFQPFFQLNPSVSHIYGGTGLGLVISRKLSQLLGGNAWVESEEGIGSTFYFSIVAQVGNPEFSPSISPSSSPPLPFCPISAFSFAFPPSKYNYQSYKLTNHDHRSLSFIILDESEVGAESLAHILTALGHTSYSTQDPAWALEQVQGADHTTTIDAVFITRSLHAHHPELAAELRKHCAPVFLTGTPDTCDYHSTAIPPEVHDETLFASFLSKPFRIDSVRKLADALSGADAPLNVAIATSPQNSPLPSPITAPLRILVAEDNVINRKVASRILDKLGYSMYDIVENGQQVLDALDHKIYDVILMDIQMPVMDGWTATEEIHKKFPPDHRPIIIAMTAYAYEHDQQKCSQLGMKAHIAKPVDMALLADTLRSCQPRMDG